MASIDFSLILPCYNEGPTFESSVSKVVNTLRKLKTNWEIIFVEDKSSDNTKKSVEKLVLKITRSRAIYHSKNLGRGKSVADGIVASKGEICGYLDVDLEVSAEYIPLFIKEVQAGYDMVAAQRFYEGGGLGAFSRFLASKVYAYSVKILFNSSVEDTEAGYKFFRRKKIVPILAKVIDKHWFWDTEICIKASIAGLKISQVPVLFRRRADKKSTVRLLPDTIDYIINLVRLRKELASKV